MFNINWLANNKQLFSINNQSIIDQQFLADVEQYRLKVKRFIASTPLNISNEHSNEHSNKGQSIARSRVILFHPCVYQFAVRLFALALENITIILPANGQLKTLEGLFANADAIAGEYQTAFEFTSIENYNQSPNRIKSTAITPSNNIEWPTKGTLIFSTSGSSGEPKLVEKSWHQINTELATLSATFSLKGDNVFLATVSHQHIYGLLFRLLWPLSKKATIEDTIEYPEHGIRVLAKNTAVVLISSPAFLKRLAQDNVFIDYKSNLSRVFSSGGPLADADAITLYQQFSQGVVQVYGSTETGGIGYRSVTRLPAVSWQTFAGIHLTIEADTQRFCLQSPYINEVKLLLDDKGELNNNGGFSLLGRVDRTIKLEEKRLNLDDLEQHLLRSLYVSECRVMVLNDARSTLVAVVCLNESGVALKSSLTAFAFNQQLKQHLLERFERVCLPRKWRYLDQLPYNSQGKLNHSALGALFE